MNYRLVTCLLASICSTIHTQENKPERLTNQDIANHAQFWVSKYVPELNQEEITLISNLLYLNTRLIDDQIKVGNAILFAYVHAGMINNLALVSEEDAQKVALASSVALRKLKKNTYRHVKLQIKC